MESVNLIGAEAVERAGHNMRSAANEIQQAANQIQMALYDHQRFLAEWIERFEQALREKSG